MFRNSLVLVVGLASASLFAEEGAGERLNFVSCPIVRDTTTVPCWLSEHEGELYYLGIQTDISSDFHPPYLGHQVIVEGVVSDKPRICGGVVLEPVVISPVAERDANCDQILPVHEDYVIDFNPRPPGPSGGRLAFQNAPAPAPRPAQAEPEGGPRDFVVHYYFDGKVEGRNAGDLSRILRHAQEVEARRLEITGYAGDILLSDGSLLREREGLAQARAEEVASLLQGAGLEVEDVRIDWQQGPAADGVDDWRERRTEVRVIPAE